MNEVKSCQNCKQSFAISPDDFSFYKKMDVPPPKACPMCRQKNRIIFRNFKTLYKRPSSKSGKMIVSMYHPMAVFPVWSRDEWWADDWDPKSYGRDIDFSQPIFPQIKALWDIVPRSAVLHAGKTENCDYSNGIFDSKNCYLLFGVVDSEDCAYGHIVWNSKQCFDNLYAFKSEACYECIDVLGSYRLMYSQECEDCTDSIGLFDCRGCTNCIGCVGLRKKSYHIFNEPVSKEVYEKFLKEYPLNDQKTIKYILEKRAALERQMPKKYFYGSHNVGVSGNHIYNAKNLHDSFDVKSGENSKFIFTVRSAVDSYDISFTAEVELGYNTLTTGGTSRNMIGSHYCVGSSDTFYSDECFNCREVFACAGLRKAEYCILNKQYSKDEYLALKARLIEHMKQTGEWGEFFPKEMSSFGYNESIINEYHPLTKEQALATGYKWQDDIPVTAGAPTKKVNDLPQNPADYTNDLVNDILACNKCHRNYRLIPDEISFYKKMNLALPLECFNCRHQRRMDMRNRRELWPGKCAKCGADFMTSYSPAQQKEYKIYCEQCYQKEMV